MMFLFTVQIPENSTCDICYTITNIFKDFFTFEKIKVSLSLRKFNLYCYVVLLFKYFGITDQM